MRWLLLATMFGTVTWSAPATLQTDFGSPLPTSVYLTQHGAEPGPSLKDGALELLHGQTSQQNTIAWDRVGQGAYSRIEVTLELRIQPGADGVGVALLSTKDYGTTGPAPSLPEWEEPNLTGSFAVGFDVYNPKTDSPFDANGNIHGRPEREVSLHWDGAEMANALSPVEFRDGRFHAVRILLTYSPGGGTATVEIDGTPVHDQVFIATATPYESRLAIGARTGGLTTTAGIDDVTATFSEPSQGFAEPLTVKVFDGAVLDSQHQHQETEVTLPGTELKAARLVLTLSLAAPPDGIDPWDRGGAVYVWDGEQRHEIVRFITPFGRPYTWHVDVTDYQSLLRGKRKMGAQISTWVKGWSVSVDLAYYPGHAAREAFEVRTIWSGDWEYGNPEQPLAARFAARHEPIPVGTVAAELRVMVTGHGQSPTTHNAGEFMPADRTVTVDGHVYENRLWKTDVYLNPCRPQGGTWKYDRAGWGPGSICEPWVIDLTDIVKPGETATFDYAPMPYVNEARDKARASHWVEVQLMLYRAAGARR